MSLSRLFAAPLLATLLFSVGVISCFAYTPVGDEVIEKFDARYDIQKDGSVEIREVISYDFADNQKHGIYRDIPFSSVDGPRIGVDVKSVNDLKGNPYTYTATAENDTLRIKIGDANVLVTGSKEYVIDYVVTNAIRPFEDHDELYWNVTGNGWPVVIQKASADVILPGPTNPDITTACFTGSEGSTGKNCTSEYQLGGVGFHAPGPLMAGEGLTIVAGFPLGIVDDAVAETPAGEFTTPSEYGPLTATDWAIVLVPLAIVLALFGLALRAVIRIYPPKRTHGAVVVEYHPPDDLPPIDVGTLLDQAVDTKDISSVILDLAVRGYLKIKYTVKEIPFWPDKKDFELIKTKDGSALSHPAEKILFALFFDGRESVTLSKLLEDKTVFQSDLKKIEADTEQHLRDAGYFDQAAKEKAEKLTKKFGLLSVAAFLVFALLTFATFGLGFFLVFPAVIIIGIGAFGIRKLAHQLSDKGWEAVGKILGFKEFLQLTEKDKLELLNAPKLEPQTFEKFLPYAMVLGVEDQWAKKFEGIYQSTPNWYEDPTNHVFSSSLLMNNLRGFNNSFNQTVVNSAPHTSSSGFSGGSSGGGSGGGGGGSW